MQKPTESVLGKCLICGSVTRFISYEPINTPCKRNSFYCASCNSISRSRHISKVILDNFSDSIWMRYGSLKALAKKSNITILHTCDSGAIAETMRSARNLTISEFFDNVPSGNLVNGTLSQNLEKTTFSDNTFDLVITEDIFEHIADPVAACNEIRRILKPGGMHISTIAVLWDQERSVTRALIQNGNFKHILPPNYHGDPNRKEGILVFTDFGSDIVERYLKITGPTEVIWSVNNRIDERLFAIYHNMIFISTKAAFAL